MIYKELLVIGCPRSGTSFYTKCLQSMGHKVNHEHMGEDGTVSGFFYGDHSWYPYKHEAAGEKRGDYCFGSIQMIVRNPLYTIPSMAVLLSGGATVPARRWYSEFYDMTINPESDCILEAAQIWSKSYHYMLTNEHLDEIIRLEDLAEDFPSIEVPNRSFKDQYKKPLTWEELTAKVGEELALDILDFACIFGYEEGDRCILK